MATFHQPGALELLAGIAELAGSPRSPEAGAAALRDVLLRSLPCLRVDVDWWADESRESSEARDTLENRAPVVIDVVRAGVRGIEIERARRAGAKRLLRLPISDHHGVVGAVSVSLGAVSRDSLVLQDDLLKALARVTSVAVQGGRLIERVATVSRRAYSENRHLREELRRVSPGDPIVAASPSMQRAVEMTDLVAREESTVLLLGESGTGKEVLARRVHALSSRAARPMLKVNCGALPETLVESSLFGHERGAFTGALQRHLGLFERAHGGTLFLDEVAELPPMAQVKLLRVLQEGELQRVGGETTVHVDVRVIAATHRPLEEMIAAGTFRADLYYRLNVFPIDLSPLRERPEDLPLLAEAILERLAARRGRSRIRLTAAALQRLQKYAWPGNVRELENVLERAVVLSPQETLRLPDGFDRKPAKGPVLCATADELPVKFADWERRGLEAALSACGGRIYGPSGAAARLGLKPTTLQSKLRKLKVRREAFVGATEARRVRVSEG